MLVIRKITEKWEVIIIPAIFLLFITLAYYNIIYLEQVRPGRMLEKTMQNMEQNFEHLKIDIKERGRDHKIAFTGNILGNEVVYGEILDYSLKIMKAKNSGELYIKDLKDNIWKKASEVGLESLDNLLISPFQLLDSCSHLFKEAKFVNYQSGKEKVILINISPGNLQKTGFFDDYSTKEIWIECLIFVDEDKLFINRLILSLYDNGSDDNIIYREFSFALHESINPATFLPSVTGGNTDV